MIGRGPGGGDYGSNPIRFFLSGNVSLKCIKISKTSPEEMKYDLKTVNKTRPETTKTLRNTQKVWCKKNKYRIVRSC